VLDDDLSKDKLKLDGLDLASVETTRDPGVGDTTIRRFLYRLTSYRVDLPSLKIGALSVRYYVKRPGQRLEDAVAAGELQVPGAARSTTGSTRSSATICGTPSASPGRA